MAHRNMSIIAGHRVTLPEPIKLHRQLDFLLAEYESFGDKIALTAANSHTTDKAQQKVMTFRQLKDTADSFAACLRQKLSAFHNLQQQPTVAIIASLDNISCVALLFGILKCGAACCWLTPPPALASEDNHDRIGQWQVQLESGLRCVNPALVVIDDDDIIQHYLTPATIQAQYNILPLTLLQQLASSMLDIDRIALEEELMHADMAFSSDHSPAVILYSARDDSVITLSHMAISNQLATLWRCLPFAADEISVWHSPLSSARHIFELLAPLLFGRPVVVIQGGSKNLRTGAGDFFAQIRRHRPRRLFLTALQLELLVGYVESTAKNGMKNDASNRRVQSHLRVVCVIVQLGGAYRSADSTDTGHGQADTCTYERDFHCNPHLIRRFFRHFADCRLALLYTAQALCDTFLSWTLLEDADDESTMNDLLPLGVPALNSCLCIATSSGVMVRRGATGLLWAVNTSLPQLTTSIHSPTKNLRAVANFRSSSDDETNGNGQNTAGLYEQVPPHFTNIGVLVKQGEHGLVLVDSDPAQTLRLHSGDNGWLSLQKIEYELREALVGERHEPGALHSLLLKSPTRCFLLVAVQIHVPLTASSSKSTKERPEEHEKKSSDFNSQTGDEEAKLKLLHEREISVVLARIMTMQFLGKRGLRPEFSWRVCAVVEPFPLNFNGTLDSVKLLTLIKRQLIFYNLTKSTTATGEDRRSSANYYHLYTPSESQRVGDDDDVWVSEDSMPLATKSEKGGNGRALTKRTARRKATVHEQSIVRALMMTRQNHSFAIFNASNVEQGASVKLERSIFDQGIHYNNIVEFLRNAHSLGAALTLNDLVDTDGHRTIAALATINSGESEAKTIASDERASSHQYIVKPFSQLSFVEIDQALMALANAIINRSEYDMYVDTSVSQYRKLFDQWKRLPDWREQSFALFESANRGQITGIALGSTWVVQNQLATVLSGTDDSVDRDDESTDDEQHSQSESKHTLLNAAHSVEHPLLSIILETCDENERKLTTEFLKTFGDDTSPSTTRIGRLLYRMPVTVSDVVEKADKEANFVAVAVQLEQEATRLASLNKCELLIAHCTNSFQQSMTEYQLGYDEKLYVESMLKHEIALRTRLNVLDSRHGISGNGVMLTDLTQRMPDSTTLISRGINLMRQTY